MKNFISSGSPRWRVAGGFSLIELIVAVVIVAILASIAYPSYTQYVTATRRGADGQRSMLQLAARLEKFNSSCGSYTSTITGGTMSACTGLELGALGDMSSERHYQMTVTLGLNAAGVATGYTINAAPQGAQATRDTECATLTLTSAGVKGISGGTGTVDQCWKK